MRNTLTVVDDFLSDIDDVVQMARELDYKPVEYEGFTYSGIGGVDMYWPDISKVVGRNIEPVKSLFRLGTIEQQPTTWIHNDYGVVGAKWATVLYLNDPPAGVQSGTAFWTHKDGFDEQPEIDQEGADQLNQEGQELENWEWSGFAAMRKNRAVIYPSSVFHSRWPKQGFGKDVDDGRLIWAGFFV